MTIPIQEIDQLTRDIDQLIRALEVIRGDFWQYNTEICTRDYANRQLASLRQRLDAATANVVTLVPPVDRNFDLATVAPFGAGIQVTPAGEQRGRLRYRSGTCWTRAEILLLIDRTRPTRSAFEGTEWSEQTRATALEVLLDVAETVIENLDSALSERSWARGWKVAMESLQWCHWFNDIRKFNEIAAEVRIELGQARRAVNGRPAPLDEIAVMQRMIQVDPSLTKLNETDRAAMRVILEHPGISRRALAKEMAAMSVSKAEATVKWSIPKLYSWGLPKAVGRSGYKFPDDSLAAQWWREVAPQLAP